MTIDEVRKNLVKGIYDTLKGKGYDVDNENGIRFPFKADGNDVVATIQEYDKYVDTFFTDNVYPHVINFSGDDSFAIMGNDDEDYDFEYTDRDFSTDALTDFRTEIGNLPNRSDAEYSARGLSKGDEINWHGNTAEVVEISEWGDTWTLKLANGEIYLAGDDEVVEQNPDLVTIDEN